MVDLTTATAAAREALALFNECPSVVECDGEARAAIAALADLLVALAAAEQETNSPIKSLGSSKAPPLQESSK